MHAVALNCSLKSGDARSSTQHMLELVRDELERHDVTCEILRATDHVIAPGVSSDEGGGDEWPMIRQKVLDAPLFVLGTPIWVGHPSSLAQRVIERMDAFLGEQDDEGRIVSSGRVAMVAVVGNEDGAHHVHAELFQGLNDLGFTLAHQAGTYWVGEAMQATDLIDLPEVPEKVTETNRLMVRNAVHLARVLQAQPYPTP